MIISEKYGECISNPLNKKQAIKKPEKTKSRSLNNNNLSKMNVKIIKMDLANTDYIILGSNCFFMVER